MSTKGKLLSKAYRKKGHPTCREGVQKWELTDISDTLNCYEYHSDARTPILILETYDARGNGNGEISNTLTGDHQDRITDYTSIVVRGGQ